MQPLAEPGDRSTPSALHMAEYRILAHGSYLSGVAVRVPEADSVRSKREIIVDLNFGTRLSDQGYRT